MCPTPNSANIYLDLSLQDATTGVRQAVVPCAGEVMEVWVGAQVLPTAGNVAVAKGAINLLAGTNADIKGSGGLFTAGVGMSVPLATAITTRRVAAGDVITATWTIGTAGSMTAASCIVVITPDTW